MLDKLWLVTSKKKSVVRMTLEVHLFYAIQDQTHHWNCKFHSHVSLVFSHVLYCEKKQNDSWQDPACKGGLILCADHSDGKCYIWLMSVTWPRYSCHSVTSRGCMIFHKEHSPGTLKSLNESEVSAKWLRGSGLIVEFFFFFAFSE